MFVRDLPEIASCMVRQTSKRRNSPTTPTKHHLQGEWPEDYHFVKRKKQKTTPSITAQVKPTIAPSGILCPFVPDRTATASKRDDGLGGSKAIDGIMPNPTSNVRNLTPLHRDKLDDDEGAMKGTSIRLADLIVGTPVATATMLEQDWMITTTSAQTTTTFDFDDSIDILTTYLTLYEEI